MVHLQIHMQMHHQFELLIAYNPCTIRDSVWHCFMTLGRPMHCYYNIYVILNFSSFNYFNFVINS